jgi:hypothetical protein
MALGRWFPPVQRLPSPIKLTDATYAPATLEINKFLISRMFQNYFGKSDKQKPNYRIVHPLCIRVLPPVSFVWKLPVALHMWVLPTASFVWILQVTLYMWVLLAVSFVWILQVALYMRVLPAISFVWILQVPLYMWVLLAVSFVLILQVALYMRVLPAA